MLETDGQTLDDLRIFEKRDTPGIFDLYNHTHTRGGEDLLRNLFMRPLAAFELISERIATIAGFAKLNLAFPFDGALFDLVEKYVYNQADNAKHDLGDKDIYNGVTSIIQLLQLLKDFLHTAEITQLMAFKKERSEMLSLLNDPILEPVFKDKPGNKIPYTAVTAFDLLFRSKANDLIQKLLRHIYQMDAYLSVAHTAVKQGFTFPSAHPKGSGKLNIQGLYHPELKQPVPNNIRMNHGTNMVFLTGANMAGKSTFLRSFGTAIYLAHMGFPVAASQMEFSVMDGVYTTINLPDNLGIGASHFYAEVLRVKKIATELKLRKSIFVIFDELFRGTNVKDAHEATVAVAQAFAGKDDCRFIISSHIVEAADALRKKPSIDFLFLPTRMNGHTPEYTYTLEAGVTDDRHGMIIIRNEGILDILKNGKKQVLADCLTS